MNYKNKPTWMLAAITATILSTTTLVGCGDDADSQIQTTTTDKVVINPDPFPSTYTPIPSTTTLITNVTIIDGIGGMQANSQILMADGKIVGLGAEIDTPDDVMIIDGAGKYVTPGIIDTHSHLGVYPSPDTRSHADGNEMTSPVTAQVWAEHSVWPQDPGFQRALAGGVTA